MGDIVLDQDVAAIGSQLRVFDLHQLNPVFVSESRKLAAHGLGLEFASLGRIASRHAWVAVNWGRAERLSGTETTLLTAADDVVPNSGCTREFSSERGRSPPPARDEATR